MSHDMKIHCAQCGAEVAPDDRFCGECGAPIETRSTEAPAPVTAAAPGPVKESPRARARGFRPGSSSRIMLVLGILLFPVVLSLIWIGIRELGNPGYVSAIAIIPNGGLLATGGQRGQIMIWRLPDMKLVTEFHHGNSNLKIETLQFDKKGERLAVDGDRTMAVYELSGGQARKTLEVEDNQDNATYAGLCLDGTTLYGVLGNGELKVWNQEKNWSGMPTGDNLARDISKSDWEFKSDLKFTGYAVFSQDCRRLVAGYRGASSNVIGEYIGLYDVAEGWEPGEQLLYIKGVAAKTTFGNLEDLVFLGNGDTFAAIDYYNKKKAHDLDRAARDDAKHLRFGKSAKEGTEEAGVKSAIVAEEASLKTAEWALEAARKTVKVVPVDAAPKVVALAAELGTAEAGLKTAQGALEAAHGINKGVEVAVTAVGKGVTALRINRLGAAGSIRGIVSGGREGTKPVLIIDVDIHNHRHVYRESIGSVRNEFKNLAREVAKEVAREVLKAFSKA